MGLTTIGPVHIPSGSYPSSSTAPTASDVSSSNYKTPEDFGYSSSLGGGIGELLFGTNSSAQSKADTYNAALNNELNRQWYTEMDSTKYQRMVADAKAAGINPYYLVNSGASSSASSSSGNAPTAFSGKSESSLSSLARVLAIALTALKIFGA